MPNVPLFQVDAFTDRPFAGNPAAVCPLEGWLPDATMQAVAAENNLSETAFFVPRADGGFDLRWFTPTTEVDLCGHATLASAFVLMTRLDSSRDRVTFHSASGPLAVTRDADRFVLDFPARSATPCEPPAGLARALGVAPEAIRAVLRARDHVVVLDDAETVRMLTPDLEWVRRLDAFAVCVTAPGTGGEADVDFVSRFFAPARGVSEDPVTGSSHCTLTPYWADRLGRARLRARQVSARGGELWLELTGHRVGIGGQAVLVLEGTLRV